MQFATYLTITEQEVGISHSHIVWATDVNFNVSSLIVNLQNWHLCLHQFHVMMKIWTISFKESSNFSQHANEIIFAVAIWATKHTNVNVGFIGSWKHSEKLSSYSKINDILFHLPKPFKVDPKTWVAQPNRRDKTLWSWLQISILASYKLEFWEWVLKKCQMKSVNIS